MEETRIEKIKNHLKKHKATYITGGVCFIAGAVLYKVFNETTTTISTESGQFNIQKGLVNYWINNSTTVEVSTTGHGDIMVWCDELKTLYPSISAAARAIGADRANLSRHLQGKFDHIKGYHFQKVGENLYGEATIAPI